MEILGHEFNPYQWRLFIDSSKVSMKVVLLHNGNSFPSVPLADTANMKESYENMRLLLGKFKYDDFKWKLRVELKVVALLLGTQLGYITYCCLLCEWDSWDKKNHCVNRLFHKLTSLTAGEKNVVSPPLVLPEKILLPSLHIKLDHLKIFVKGMDKTGRGFEYLRNVSDAKIKEGIFIGPPVRGLKQDKQFDEDLNETERNAWLSFKRICKDFLGNHKTAMYQDVVQDLLTSHKDMGCTISLKIHFLESHLEFLPRKSRRSQ